MPCAILFIALVLSVPIFFWLRRVGQWRGPR